MTKQNFFATLTVTETGAKVLRVWEELGGPEYLRMNDAKELFDQMTLTEQEEVPTWPKHKDPAGVYQYELPKRFQRKIRQ